MGPGHFVLKYRVTDQCLVKTKNHNTKKPFVHVISFIIYLFVPLIDMTFHQKIVNSPLIEIFT